MGLNGTLVEAKMRTWGHLNERILASTSVPFRPTTAQMLNLAQIGDETDDSLRLSKALHPARSTTESSSCGDG